MSTINIAIESTRTRFARTILWGALVSLTLPLLQAQAQLKPVQLKYTYQGSRTSGTWQQDDPFHGQLLTAKLITDDVLPTGRATHDSTEQPCPKSWTFTIAVGNTIYDSQTAYRSNCFYMKDPGDALLPVIVVLEIEQGDASEGAGARICSSLGCHPALVHAFKEQFMDVAGPYGASNAPPDRSHRQLQSAFAPTGRWSPPQPAEVAAALLTRVTAMNTSLISQITSLRDDLSNGTPAQACTDLQASRDQVTAQTGNAISPADAATTLRWLESISSGIPCAAK